MVKKSCSQQKQPDDNGIIDTTETKNHAVMHLIAKGIWIKNANQKIRVTPLSEIIYTYIERDNFKDLESSLTKYSEILLKASLDADSTVNAKDIMLFNPLQDKALLYDTLTYNNIVHQLRAGNSNYRNSIFNAYIVESFQSNAIEIVGSNIYTIDMTGTGEFNIYDLETKEKIGGLKLPDTPFEEDTHVLYVNVLGPHIIISSLKAWSYEININNQNKPILNSEPNILTSVLSGSFTHIAIGNSNILDLFGKEKQTHLYNYINNIEKLKLLNFLILINIISFINLNLIQNYQSLIAYGLKMNIYMLLVTIKCIFLQKQI